MSTPLTTSQVNQRRMAAQASANRRRGSGTKEKNPQTPHTVAAERVRRRSNQDAPKQPKGGEVAAAIKTGKPVKIVAGQLRSTVTKLKAAGYTVKTQSNGSIGVTLGDGKTLTLEEA